MIRRDEFIRTHPDVRTGMEAYDDKGERLGVIERVDDDGITIEKGHIFHHDVSLPYDAIEDIRQDQVIIRRGEGFEEGRLESEEELERQYERDRSAREEPFEGEREAMYEQESARGDLGTEETTMRESFETRENLGMDEASMQEDFREESSRRDLGTEEVGRAETFEEGPRREPGLEEADITGRPSAASGWEERESPRSEEEVRIPVREEELETQKLEREGELRIHKEVHTETQHLEVPVEKEEVTVERVPVEEGRSDLSDENAFREQEVRIPLREEEVEVTKRPVVKEEIRARKETRKETAPIRGEVRKEEVKIEPDENVQKKNVQK